MADLTPEQKATLLQLIADNGLTQEADSNVVANKLNAPTTTTVPGVTRPKPFAWEQLMACLSPEHALGLLQLPAITTIVDQVNAQDRAALKHWAGGFAYTGLISPTEQAAFVAILDATDTSPDTTIDGPSLFATALPGFYHVVEGVGYGRCTAALIAEARS